MILYVDEIIKDEAIADEIKGEIFNAKIGCEELKKKMKKKRKKKRKKKKKVSRRMREGEEEMWVGTNALGVRIDIANQILEW